MIYKIPTSQPGLVCVVFELPSCVWADRIVVSGTFNNWDERAVTMQQDRDGVWRARLELPMGQRSRRTSFRRTVCRNEKRSLDYAPSALRSG